MLEGLLLQDAPIWVQGILCIAYLSVGFATCMAWTALPGSIRFGVMMDNQPVNYMYTGIMLSGALGLTLSIHAEMRVAHCHFEAHLPTSQTAQKNMLV